MKTRGRDSAASQEIAAIAPVDAVQRPDAPYDLTDEQSEEWWAVVNRMPADWFTRETHGLLAQYCRHVVSARHVAQLIAKAEKAKTLDIDEYNQLLIMQEREGRALSSLATRMRISQQGSYDAKKSKGKVVTENPWD
jgi:chaperone required for assembly of F1-ATPase